MTSAHPPETEPSGVAAGTRLQRRLSLPLLVLYGLGVTVGAGIYVLIGLTASEAGMFTSWSFLLAAVIVGFSGLTYAQLSTMYPVSAGEAMYVEHAFQQRWLTLAIGLTVAAVGLVSSATISIGAAAYLQQLLPLPTGILILLIVLGLGAVAVWGILESVLIAAVFTIVELAGLAFVVVFALQADPTLVSRLNELVPPLSLDVWAGIASGGLIAFFAFVGFEDLANVAEEAKSPETTMPAAILWTLGISTFFYLAVTAVVILSVPLDQLRLSPAPLILVFGENADFARSMLTIIAGVATLNGVLIQMIMASRVLYGLADRGRLPKTLAVLNSKTKTPVVATALVSFVTLALALLIPVQALAELTSIFILVVFSIVNLALIRLNQRAGGNLRPAFRIPAIVPWMGLFTSLALVATSLL